MAASDWVSAALDHTGAAFTGPFDFGGGVSVKLHRGWLNLYDAKAERRDPKDGYLYPNLSINSGDLHYGDIHIRAARCKTQEGVLAAVFRSTYSDGQFSSVGFIGIGVCGYARDEDRDWEVHERDDGSTFKSNRYVGIRAETVSEFRALLDQTEERFAWVFGDEPERHSLGMSPSGPFEDLPDDLRALDLSCLRQVNAGDQFFHDHGALPDLPATPVGEIVTPLGAQIVRSLVIQK